MYCIRFKGKRVAIALFSFFFLSACSQSPRVWQLTSNKGKMPHFCSSRLYLAAENDFSGLEVEILNTPQGQAVYVNAFSVELEPEEKSPEGYSIITVTLTIHDQTREFSGFLLQGGHRILLSEDASRVIFETLYDNQEIKLSVGHYSTNIIPDNFVKHHQKLN